MEEDTLVKTLAVLGVISIISYACFAIGIQSELKEMLPDLYSDIYDYPSEYGYPYDPSYDSPLDYPAPSLTLPEKYT